MKIDDLKGKKVAIWGLGKEGWSAIRAIKRVFPKMGLVAFSDYPISSNDLDLINKLGDVTILSGTEGLQQLTNFEVIIKSPGISKYRPEIKKAKEEGVLFTSTTNLWFSMHPKEMTVCVTGTKGKSTTSTLIALLLKEAGLRVELGGNIGVPLLDLFDIDPNPDVWVIELSSYQTSDFEGEPSIGVLLNLYPEHLDWHGNIDNYFKDKLNLFKYLRGGISVINRLDEITSKLNIEWYNPVYFNDVEGINFSDGYIKNRAERLISVRDIALQGEHNLSNICAAFTVLNCLNIDLKRCLNVLRTFKGLPHRLSRLGEKDGIFFVDDSISTTPQSAMAAVEVFKSQPITIILGGFDRGLNYGSLASYLIKKPVHAIITIPDSGPKIAKAIRKLINPTDTSHLPQVYETEGLFQAVQIAKAITPKGGVILLSPAAPSYGKFLNFEERGSIFAEAAGFSVKN